MSDAVRAVAEHYRAIEQKGNWRVRDRSADYGRLVIPAGNSDEPFHRWFRMKEAYSFSLFGRLVKDSGEALTKPFSVLDPFSGSGTTAVSALTAAAEYGTTAHVTLIERNPVLRIIAAGKTTGLLRGSDLATTIEAVLPSVLDVHSKLLLSRPRLTTLSVTLNNENYYPASHTLSLLALSQAVESVRDPDTRLILQTCLASAVEPSGRLRRDGRALRFAPERRPSPPEKSFKEAVDRCIEDLRTVASSNPASNVDVVAGDAREADRYVDGKLYDWIVFSPPYPNNIDYTEVYKTEAWALGCFEDAAEMKKQRLSTVRSHTSIYFPDEYAFRNMEIAERVEEIIAPLVRAVPSDRYERGRKQLISGYADDMLRVFLSLRKLAHDKTRLVFVVGNSVHGSGDARLVIAADVVLSALAELSGWQVEEIRVARELRRRAGDLDHLRESVVCLRPA